MLLLLLSCLFVLFCHKERVDLHENGQRKMIEGGGGKYVGKAKGVAVFASRFGGLID